HRSRAPLPAQPQGEQGTERAPAGLERRPQSLRLESADPPAQTHAAVTGPRQTAQQSHRGRGPRTLRICLADLPADGTAHESTPRCHGLRNSLDSGGELPEARPLGARPRPRHPTNQEETTSHQTNQPGYNLNRDRGPGAAVTVIRFTRVVGGVELQSS